MRALGLMVLMAAVAGLGAPGSAGGASRRAPDFSGGGPWFNTSGKALSLADLRGKVVAVEIWTAGCINCRNVLPDLKKWHARYADRGFVIVGVHAPEFNYERAESYVRASIAKLGITYPVVMDNDFRIWRAYNNVYWPSLYLVDRQGFIRYQHFGEGAYEQTERMIRQLLNEG